MSKEFSPLKLLAKDSEDLTIIAAHLQDAMLPLAAMVYEPKDETFTLLANRFCWEHPPHTHEGKLLYHRVHTGICFRNVKKVHHKGFDRKGEHRTLNLLTLHAKKSNAVHLLFSGHGEIRIETNELKCHLSDLQSPWPTHKKPTHIHEHIQNLKNEMNELI